MKFYPPCEASHGSLETYTTRGNRGVILRVRISKPRLRSGASDSFLCAGGIIYKGGSAKVVHMRSPFEAYVRSVLAGHSHTQEIFLCGPPDETLHMLAG